MKNRLHVFGVALLAAFSSACSPDAAFSRAQSQNLMSSNDTSSPRSEESNPVFEGSGEAPEGIIGGHFDLDTSHLVYGPNNGATDHHVHEYDDKYKTNGADFFNLAEAGLGKVQAIIPPQKRFILIIANAELSKGGILEINGATENVFAAQGRIQGILGKGLQPQAFTIGVPTEAGDMKLSSLKIYFDRNVIAQNGLVPTATGCVRKNQPGANGEYRDGALTIQALDAEKFKIDPLTGVASGNDGGLLWEATIFWHRDGICY